MKKDEEKEKPRAAGGASLADSIATAVREEAGKAGASAVGALSGDLTDRLHSAIDKLQASVDKDGQNGTSGGIWQNRGLITVLAALAAAVAPATTAIQSAFTNSREAALAEKAKTKEMELQKQSNDQEALQKDRERADAVRMQYLSAALNPDNKAAYRAQILSFLAEGFNTDDQKLIEWSKRQLELVRREMDLALKTDELDRLKQEKQGDTETADALRREVDALKLQVQLAAPATAPPAPAQPQQTNLVSVVGDQLALAQRIEFKAETNNLKPASVAILDAVAQKLIADPALSLRVEGYSGGYAPDSKTSTADRERDKLLSKKRADAVVEWLSGARGINESRLQAVGLGGARPILDPRTAEGRDYNRRIEFHIISAKAPAKRNGR